MVTIENVYSKGETDKAVLCVIDDVEHWIPKSQIKDESEVWKVDQEGDLVTSDFLAEKMGLQP